jgi:hypothetical protein
MNSELKIVLSLLKFSILKHKTLLLMSKVLIVADMLKFYLIFFIINSSEVGFPCCIPEILTAKSAGFVVYVIFGIIVLKIFECQLF